MLSFTWRAVTESVYELGSTSKLMAALVAFALVEFAAPTLLATVTAPVAALSRSLPPEPSTVSEKARVLFSGSLLDLVKVE